MRYKFSLAVVIALGSFFGFSRELAIGYLFGATESVDTYKIIVSYPYGFVFTFSTLIVGIFLPVVVEKVKSEPIEKVGKGIFNDIASSLFMLIPFLSLGLLFFNVLLFNENINSTRMYILYIFSWSGILILIPYYFVRVLLQNYEMKVLSASGNLILAIVFVSLLPFFSFIGLSAFYSLYFSFLLSSLVLSISYIYILKSKFPSFNFFPFEFILPDRKLIYLLLSGVVYNLITISLRTIDRFLVSHDIGGITVVEMTFGMINGLGTVIGSLVVVLFGNFIASRKYNVRFKKELSVRVLLLFFSLIVLSFLLLYLSEYFISILWSGSYLTSNQMELMKSLFDGLLFSLPFMVVNMLLFQVMLSYFDYKIVLCSGLFKIIMKVSACVLLINYYSYDEVIYYSTLFFEILLTTLFGLIVFFTKHSEPRYD